MTTRPTNITAQEVQEKLERGDKMQIIDVREASELADTGIIPGAIHMRLSDVEERHVELDKTIETIVVCRSGRRSKSVCNFLRTQGYATLKNMAGGMLDWRGEVEDYFPE